MKKAVALLLALVLFPSMALGADSSQEAKRFKVWFDTGGGPGESYGTVLQNGAAAAARDLDLDIAFVYSDWNAEKMLENFRQGLTSKPDGMVVIGVPGDDAYEPLIDQAYAQGALVTCVDTPLPRLYKKYQSRGFGLIGPDNYNQGRMLAERCVTQFDLKEGDRVMVWGLKSLPGRGRRAQAILDARKAMQANNLAAFDTAAALVPRGHALSSYLDYWRLRIRLAASDPTVKIPRSRAAAM